MAPGSKSDILHAMQAKNVVLCRYMAEDSIGQCPVVDCGFAHSLAEIEDNEERLRLVLAARPIL